MVDGAPDRISIRLERGVLSTQAVVNVRQRRTRRHLQGLRFEPGLLAQPSEQPNANGNRYRHKAILVSDKDVNFFTGIQRPLDGGASSFRGAVPECDKHVARIDESLVAGRGLAGVRELFE